jgi:hypothetical protein
MPRVRLLDQVSANGTASASAQWGDPVGTLICSAHRWVAPPAIVIGNDNARVQEPSWLVVGDGEKCRIRNGNSASQRRSSRHHRVRFDGLLSADPYVRIAFAGRAGNCDNRQ